MNYIKRNLWILPIVGSIIALISLLTPTTYDRTNSELILIWMNQLAVRVPIYGGNLTIELLRNRLSLNLFSFACEIIIFTSTIILITITNFYRKSSRGYQKLRWKWIFLAIIITFSTLVWIINMEIAYIDSPRRHWEWYSPHFGVIGPFIGSGLIIIGAILAKDVGEKIELESKTSMSYSKKTPIILSIIGGLIAIIAIFTPTSYNRRDGTDLYYVWMNQLAVDVDSSPIELYLLRVDLFLVCFSIALLITIFASAIILITLTNIYRKYSRPFQELKIKWLILAIIITVATLCWIIYMEIFYSLSGDSHWQNYSPHFGLIGLFIASGLIMTAFFLTKDVEEMK